MFEDIDQELNNQFLDHKDGFDYFPINSPIQVVERIDPKSTEYALTWVMKEIIQHDNLSRDILANTKLMELLKKVPLKSLVRVKACHDPSIKKTHYKSFCVHWDSMEQEGVMIYIPNTTQKQLKNKIFTNVF